jgi:hypothetical protein
MEEGMTRQTYETGAERDQLDDVRYDLISPIALRRLAKTYAEGAAKYSDHNWRKGFPVSSLLNHVISHIIDYLEGGNYPYEDDLAHAAWGLFAIMEQQDTHPELDDRWDFDNPAPAPIGETLPVVFTADEHGDVHGDNVPHYHLMDDGCLDDSVWTGKGTRLFFWEWSCSDD